MKETVEFRINYAYAHLLFREDEGKNLENFIKVVELSKDDPRFWQIPVIEEKVYKKYGKGFFFGWGIIRKYSQEELDAASLLHMGIKTVFEPTGEDCGTVYDETVACPICGANRKQLGPLLLKKGRIPKRDIAKTIGDEIVVSEKFVNAVKARNLKGLEFGPTNVEKYYQFTVGKELELSDRTLVGVNPFDLSTTSSEGEIFKCPNGDTIGLNLLSEPYVLNNGSIGEYDFYASRQKIGIKRGLLRPRPLYFCSQAFKQMVEEEKLKGFNFGVAYIE